jgi:hypothetical protein
MDLDTLRDELEAMFDGRALLQLETSRYSRMVLTETEVASKALNTVSRVAR